MRPATLSWLGVVVAVAGSLVLIPGMLADSVPVMIVSLALFGVATALVSAGTILEVRRLARLDVSSAPPSAPEVPR